MNATAARHEADRIVAGLPDRISGVIKPFARQSPDHPALVQGDVSWSYADLAAIVARTAVALAGGHVAGRFDRQDPEASPGRSRARLGDTASIRNIGR